MEKGSNISNGAPSHYTVPAEPEDIKTPPSKRAKTEKDTVQTTTPKKSLPQADAAANKPDHPITDRKIDVTPPTSPHFSPSWKTFIQDYQEVKQLGLHGEGKVTLYKHKKTGEEVVIKSSKNDRNDPEIAFYEHIRTVCNEQGKSWPDYLPQYYGTIAIEVDAPAGAPQTAFAMEYLAPPFKPLVHYANQPEKKVGIIMAKQMALDLKEIHQRFNAIVGDDFDTKNIMVNLEENKCVFIDFGRCKPLEEDVELPSYEALMKMANSYFEGTSFWTSINPVNKDNPTYNDYEQLENLLKSLCFTFGPYPSHV